MHVLPSSSNHRAQPSFHVSLLGTFHHWLLSIIVAISLQGVSKNVWMVVQVALYPRGTVLLSSNKSFVESNRYTYLLTFHVFFANQ